MVRRSWPARRDPARSGTSSGDAMSGPRPPARLDRRSFLREAGACAVSLGCLVGCSSGPESRTDPGEGSAGEGEPPRQGGSRRPIVLPFGDDAILAAAPLDELPAAYVSRAQGRVYVDRELRDRAALALAAHISVSTGVWRIPLPGDPVRTPIQPGDAAREFDERPLRAWDPRSEPAEGDTRLRLGRIQVVRVTLECEAVSGTDAWCRGGPWDVPRCTPGGERLRREILGELGRARLWTDRRCAASSRAVRCLTWRAAVE
jgi:hypothetical protein